MRAISLPPSPSGHAAPLTHVALRADGRRLASCSYDGTVLVWDVSEPSKPLRLSRLRHRRLVNAAAWNPSVPGLLATASADKTVAVWRIADDGTSELVSVLARHTDDINAVDWMPDGQRLICVSEDGRATMWSALTGTYLGEIGSHTAHCMAVSVSADGLVATVGEDGMVAVRRPPGHLPGTEAETGPGAAADTAVRHYDSSVEGCAWSHSGKVLAVALDDGTVDLLTSGLDHLRTLEVSDSAARAVAWSEDDGALVVGAYDGSLHVFGVDGDRTHQVYDARVWPRSVSVARGLVAAGSFWNGPHLYRLEDGAEVSAPAAPNHGPNALAVGEGELLIGCDSGTVFAVSLPETDGSADGSAAGPTATPAVRALELADGPVLSLAARDGTVHAGTYAGHVVRLHDGHRSVSEQLGAPLPSLCFDGDTLVAGTYNGEFVALDPLTLAVTDRRTAHGGSVKSLTELDGGFLSAATDRTVAAGTLNERTTLWEHGNLVNAVAVQDGGRVAASASRDHTVKVGEIAPADSAPSGWRAHRVQTLLGPDESVKCVAVLGGPDAPVVLAGSYDFGLYVWHVDWGSTARTLASGRLLAEFTQGLSCITRLDGRHAAVAGWDGRVLVVGLGVDGAVTVRHDWHIDELAASAGGREEALTA